MSSSRAPIIKAFIAEGDLSTKQYLFVKYGTTSKQVVVAGLNEKTIGILMNAPEAGQVAEIAMKGGGGLLKLGEASLSAGDLLTPTASGTGEQADAADEWVGAELCDDGTTNDVKEVFVTGYYASKSDA